MLFMGLWHLVKLEASDKMQEKSLKWSKNLIDSSCTPWPFQECERVKKNGERESDLRDLSGVGSCMCESEPCREQRGAATSCFSSQTSRLLAALECSLWLPSIPSQVWKGDSGWKVPLWATAAVGQTMSVHFPWTKGGYRRGRAG